MRLSGGKTWSRRWLTAASARREAGGAGDGSVEERTERNVELGPFFTSGAILLAYGLVRRRALAVAAGLGAIWLDQRSSLGRTLKERVRGLSGRPAEDNRDQTGRP